MKLLIVDDEQVERQGMQAILQKAFPDLVIEQAKNGKIAVQLVKEFQPDLILMDIKMPGMNGLEAVEQISLTDPAIKFIMVTAFDTYDYLRQAIKLGVKDYLLKPSKASEIVKIVGKVLLEIKEEKKSLETMKLHQKALKKTLTLVETDVVTQLLFDHVHEVHVDMLVEMLDIQTTEEMFVMLVLVPPGSEDFYRACKEKVRKTKSGWIGPLYGSQLPIIVFRDPSKTYRSQAIHLAREILLPANSNLEGWFVGIGNVCNSLVQVRRSYQESLVATIDTTLHTKYRFYSDVPLLDDEYNSLIVKQKKDFTDNIQLGNWDKVRANIMSLINYYENKGSDLIQSQQRILEVLWLAARMLSEMGIEQDTPFYSYQTLDYRQLRYETCQLLDIMKDTYLLHYNRLEADTIHQIKQYIFEHSHEDISLDALGKKVRLSPIYISKMFKEKLGINYIDFLTECRIEKAKKLMSCPEKSIKEISFEVGYHEPNYFSKVFKKMCAISPKDYRKTLLGIKD